MTQNGKVYPVRLRSCQHKVKFTVELTTEFRVRRKIALWLFQLAGWVLEAEIEVVEQES